MKTRFIFLGIAIWDTLVTAINVYLLPHVITPEVMEHVTPTSQGLPIFLCLGMWALVGHKDYYHP